MRLNFINIWGYYVSRAIPGKLFYPLTTGKVHNRGAVESIAFNSS
jgi:hypothetical protein